MTIARLGTFMTPTPLDFRVKRILHDCGKNLNKWYAYTLAYICMFDVYLCYRHEVPVTNDPITIVHMDDDIVVVNKPASIPVTWFV
jgi:23S rRNA-/tRNA-specific pseudouridylate synthase